MAADFIGLTVLVKLMDPPTAITGLVAAVQDQQLYLKDVLIHHTGTLMPEYIINGLEIEDIEVLQNNNTRIPQPARNSPPPAVQLPPAPEASMTSSISVIPSKIILVSTPPQPSPSPAAFPAQYASLRPAQVKPKKNFVDPAILSYDRKPSRDVVSPPVINSPIPPAVPQTAPYPTDLMSPVLPEIPPEPILAQHHHHHHHDGHRDSTSNPPAKQTFEYLVLDNDTHEADQEAVVVTAEYSSRPDSRAGELARRQTIPVAGESVAEAFSGKRRRGKRPGGNKRDMFVAAIEAAATDDNPDDSSPQISRREPQITTDISGWRQTPILQSPTPRPPPKAIPLNNRKKTRKQQRMDREAQENGWATEDATDVQELGDFDFAAELDKFDKQAVFQQLREEDTTAAEDRLVSFNRNGTARPGTFGGKNLHPTEMVLEPEEMEARRGSFDADHGFSPRPSIQMPTLPRGADSSSDNPLEANGNGTGSLSSSRLITRLHRGSRGSLRNHQSSSRKSSAIPAPMPIPPPTTAGLTDSFTGALARSQHHAQRPSQQYLQNYLPYPHLSDEPLQHGHGHGHGYDHPLAEEMMMGAGTSPQHLAIPSEPGQGWLLGATLDRLEKMAVTQIEIAENMLRLVEGLREREGGD